jgi:hypothetical protein
MSKMFRNIKSILIMIGFFVAVYFTGVIWSNGKPRSIILNEYGLVVLPLITLIISVIGKLLIKYRLIVVGTVFLAYIGILNLRIFDVFNWYFTIWVVIYTVIALISTFIADEITKPREKSKLKLAVQILIICISLYIIRIFSVPAGVSSGNGNPVMVAIIPLTCFVVLFGLSWFKWLRNLKLSNFLRILIVTVSVLVMAFGIVRTVQAFDNFKVEYIQNAQKRYGVYIEPEYINQLLHGIDIHTNYLYYNYTTFLTLISLLNVMAVGYSFFKPPMKRSNV